MRDNPKQTIVNPIFEKYLFVFVAIYFLAMVVHIGESVSIRELIASFTNLLVFPIIYLVLKNRADEGMINTICKSLLLVCVFTSVVGIYQFFVDPYFLRIGSEFIAYGQSLRANGIYRAEYMQGSFLLVGIVVTLITVKSRMIKTMLLILFTTALILTFHRATWIITIIVILSYLIKIRRIKPWQLVTCIVFSVMCIYLMTDVVPTTVTNLKENPFVNERLSTDTMTERFVLYRMALRNIPKNFLFGVGSPRSDIYFHGVLEAGGQLDVALGERGGIHNLYLLIAFFYGVPAAILFIVFCVTCLFYFWRKITHERKVFFISAAMIIVYIMQNMVNMFYLDHDYGLLLALFLGIGVAVEQKNIYTEKSVDHAPDIK